MFLNGLPNMFSFCLVSCKIQRWGRNSLYIEKRCCSKMAQAFFPPKTFCFAEMTSWGFKIGLEGSFQRSCYEPGSPILKTKDVIEAKLKVWGGKNACAILEQHCWGKRIPPRCVILHESRQNIIFLPWTIYFTKANFCFLCWKKPVFDMRWGREALEKQARRSIGEEAVALPNIHFWACFKAWF